MRARRMYALLGRLDGEDLTIAMDAEGHAMGARLACRSGASVPLHVRVARRDGLPFDGVIRVYDHADPAATFADGIGSPLISVPGSTLDVDLPVPADGERWYFVRVDDAGGRSLAYTSPVWIRARR